MGKVIIFILIHFLLFPCLPFAQSVVSAAGADFEGDGGTISFTIGQLAYSFFATQDGSVAEGVQQPSIPGSVEIFETNNSIKTTFLIYPNPVADFLILESKFLPEARFTYALFSPELKLIKTGLTDPVTTTIDINGLTPGVHFLLITVKEGVVAEFQVVILSEQ